MVARIRKHRHEREAKTVREGVVIVGYAESMIGKVKQATIFRFRCSHVKIDRVNA